MSPHLPTARPLLVLLLLLSGLAPVARAQVARSPHGVEVDVPAGYRWREGYKSNPSSTTVIYLESTAEGPYPATILVNHGLATAGAKEEDLFGELRSMARAPEDTATLELPSGRFVRVDFEVKLRTPPRTLRQRYYLTLRGKHHYTFSLANLEPERLAEYLPAFDALVAGARFFEPLPPPPPRPDPAATAPVTSPAPVAARPAPTPPPATTATSPPPKPTPTPAPPATAATPPPTAPKPTQTPPPPATTATSPPPKPPAPPVKPAGTAPVASPSAPAKAPPPSAPPPGTPAPAPKPGAEPAPPRAPQRPPQNLLAKAKLLSADSEYDPDIWAAAHLIDGRVDLGWCSAPRARPPFRFVVALEGPSRLERLVVDAACPDEPGYEGVAASALLVEGSLTGPDGGWRTLLEVKLEPGKNDQAFALPAPAEARWLRLTIPGNHGHATLTELMDVRAYGQPVPGTAPATAGAAPATAGTAPATAGTAPGGLTPARSLRLDQARASREKNGPELAEGEGFAPGARVWLNLRPRDLLAGKDGKTWLEVDLVLEDKEGRELLRRDKVVDHVAPPPLPPLSPFVALHIDLPAGFPAGRYVALLVARDKVAQTSAAATCEFTVTAP